MDYKELVKAVQTKNYHLESKMILCIWLHSMQEHPIDLYYPVEENKQLRTTLHSLFFAQTVVIVWLFRLRRRWRMWVTNGGGNCVRRRKGLRSQKVIFIHYFLLESVYQCCHGY